VVSAVSDPGNIVMMNITNPDGFKVMQV